MVRFLIISVLFATFVRVEYWFLGAIDPLALPSIFATACVCLALLTERHHVWPIWIGVSLGWMLCWPEGASWVWALCSLLLGAGTGLHSYIAWRALSYRPRSSVPSFSFIVRRLLGVGPLGAIGSALFVGLAAVCAGIHDAGSVAYYTLCVWLVNATFPILFTPFMLFFFKRLGRGRGLSREFFGVLLVLVLFVCLLRWVGLVSEQSTQRDARRQQVSRYESRFRRHIDLSFALLYSINSFFQSSDKVTRKEFETFTHQLIKQARGIMAFSWNPVVLAKEREAFEKQTRQEGFSHFSISERRKQGTMVRAAHRPLYVPVHYIVPLSRNRAAFGFDLYSNAKRRLALERARDSGKPVATDRIILVQEKQSTWAVIVFFPVYDWRARVPITNVTMRRKHLRGYLSAVFRISDMLRAAIPSSGRSQWLLRCTDKGAAPAKATLWQDEEVFDAPSLRMLLVGQRRSFSDAVTLPFADRIWQIHFQQRMGAFVSLPSLFYLSFVFLGFVLAFGGLLFQFQLALKKIEQEQIIKTLLTEMEARTQAQQDAFVSTRTKSRFLANMSHELRTPLNIIVGFSEILIDDPEEPLTERSKSYAENIRQSSLHLLSLINDILDLAKVDSEEISLHREEVRATTWFEQIHASVLPLAQKKQLKVTLSLKELPETINIDPKKSRQVVLNLLSNAIKFCAPKGHVALSVWTDKDDLCIEVKDDGIGLKWEDQERIFNEFEQVDDSLSRQHEGTGLGLSLARRLAELHGGTVEVFSEGLGMGSTFTALLSLVPSESELPAEALEE